MATEHEIDRMVIRLIGDQDEYQKMLEDVEKQTEESASWAEKQGSRITEAFNKAFRSAQGMMSSIGSTMQKAGSASMAGSAAISAPLGKAALDFSEYGKSISDLVKQSERSAKEAKELKKGILEGTEAFKEISKVIKISTEEAAAFKLMSERTGESIEDLTKTIKTNSAEYETWRKEAEKFGLVLGKDAIKDAKDLSESWVRVKQALSGMWTQLGSVVADGFKEWNDLIIGVVTWTTKWIRENKELISTIAKTAEKLMVVGGALVAVGTAISTISTVLGPLTAMIAAGAAAWLAWDTATGKFLQGSASQVWEQYGEAVKSAYETTVEYGRQIIAYTDKILTGVFDAVKAGNLELAVEILWSGVKVAWISSIDELDKITGERFGAIFQNLAAGNWKSALEAALNEVLLLWNKLLLAVDPIFTQIVNKANTTWTEIVNGLDTAWVEIQNIVGMIQAVFKDAADNVMVYWTLVKTYFTGLADFIKLTWDTSFGGMLGVAGYFVTNITTIFGKVKDIVIAAVSGFGGILGTAVTLPIKLAMEALSKVSGIAAEIGDIETGITAAGAFSTFAPKTAIAAGMMKDAADGIEGIPLVTGAQDAETQRRAQRERELAGRTSNRTWDTEDENIRRTVESDARQLKIKEQIVEIEKRQEELQAQGQADAAAKLEAEQEVLRVKLEQAEAEAELAAAEAASASKTSEAVEAARVLAGEYERVAKSRRDAYDEQYDPVVRYMKRLKELNSAFKEAERGGKVYQEALRDINEELASASFKIEVQYSTTGLEAVRGNSVEFLRIAETQQEAMMALKARDKALAEADKRQAEFDHQEEAAKQKETETAKATAQIEVDQAREALNSAKTPEEYERAKSQFAEAQARFDGTEGVVQTAQQTAEERATEAANLAVGTSSIDDLSIEDSMKWSKEYQRSLQESRATPKESIVTGAKDEKSLGFLGRMTTAIEKMVDKRPIQLEPLGAS